MDKKFQDIHLVDSNNKELFVLRMVEIESIDMHDSNSIIIWIEIYSTDPGIWKPLKAPIYLPKMKGCKLIID